MSNKKYMEYTRSINYSQSVYSMSNTINWNILDDNYKKKHENDQKSKARIIQDNLVFVNGLPSDATAKELERQTYFARYGTIQKIVVNSPTPFKRGSSNQAYVTYQSDLNASIAIVALDGYQFCDRLMKVSYGTTKYCSHFVRGDQCPNKPDCIYLHKLQKDKEVNNSHYIFKQQNNRAVDIVTNNLKIIAERIVNNEELQRCQEGFPSLSEMADFLIDSDIITQQQLDQLIGEIKLQKKHEELKLNGQQKNTLERSNTSLSHESNLQQRSQEQQLIGNNKKMMYHSEIKSSKKADNGNINIRNGQIIQKLEKSSSFSTMSSPIKQSNRNKQLQNEDKVQKINNFKQEQIKQKQINVEQKIEKLIIKQLLKNNMTTCKSKFDFGRTYHTNAMKQCIKIKGIVQKYLIAQI